MNYSAMDIRHYTNDNIVKLCDVGNHWFGNNWVYKNVNKELMYSTHRSWVYFIVVDNNIYKIGETGNPLGIPLLNSDQPMSGTKGRMGRLANHRGGTTDTDVVIREALKESVAKEQVSIYVRKCDIVSTPIQLGDITTNVQASIHKDLEVRYLDYIFNRMRQYPELNKLRK